MKFEYYWYFRCRTIFSMNNQQSVPLVCEGSNQGYTDSCTLISSIRRDDSVSCFTCFSQSNTPTTAKLLYLHIQLPWWLTKKCLSQDFGCDSAAVQQFQIYLPTVSKHEYKTMYCEELHVIYHLNSVETPRYRNYKIILYLMINQTIAELYLLK